VNREPQRLLKYWFAPPTKNATGGNKPLNDAAKPCQISSVPSLVTPPPTPSTAATR
jgi:hypothetical protein